MPVAVRRYRDDIGKSARAVYVGPDPVRNRVLTHGDRPGPRRHVQWLTPGPPDPWFRGRFASSNAVFTELGDP
jgi:hypothetical protein